MDPIPVVIESFGSTDKGMAREHNEDQFLVANLHRSLMVEQTGLDLDGQTRLHGNLQGTLLLVADGMGGESAGDRASQMAVQTIVDYTLNSMPWFYRLDEQLADELVAVLRQGIARCEEKIWSYQAESNNEARMGTTLTMAYVLWPNMYVVHAGDSRCYRIRDGKLEQLTRDHTVAQLMADRGDTDTVDEEKYGHVLWNAVGADSAKPVKAQVNKFELAFGDTIVLCSDGLYGMMAEDRIMSLVTAAPTSQRACDSLVEEANANGGHDNVTVVVSRFRQELVDDEDAPTVMV